MCDWEASQSEQVVGMNVSWAAAAFRRPRSVRVVSFAWERWTMRSQEMQARISGGRDGGGCCVHVDMVCSLGAWVRWVLLMVLMGMIMFL